MSEIPVIGIMNGTSLDGVDFVLVHIKKTPRLQVRFSAEKFFSFPTSLRSNLMQACLHQLRVDELGLLHHELGRFYSECYEKLPRSFKRCHWIGLHGQTVYHEPPKGTLQIGESSYLAAVSGKKVIHDFRVADLSWGGQGAPLATLFHAEVLAKLNPQKKIKCVAIHNLGGISNLTLVQSGKVKLSFDTGPANMLIDAVLQRRTRGAENFDRNGKRASQGQINEKLLHQFLQHKFFKRPPPKSCGREEFGEVFLKTFHDQIVDMELNNLVATVTALSVQSIAQAYRSFVDPLPQRIVFCGGGALNRSLIQGIQNELPEVEMCTSADLGWPVSSVEGGAFALLAAYRMWDKPGNFPATTGAKKKTILGKITG